MRKHVANPLSTDLIFKYGRLDIKSPSLKRLLIYVQLVWFRSPSYFWLYLTSYALERNEAEQILPKKMTQSWIAIELFKKTKKNNQKSDFFSYLLMMITVYSFYFFFEKEIGFLWIIVLLSIGIYYSLLKRNLNSRGECFSFIPMR